MFFGRKNNEGRSELKKAVENERLKTDQFDYALAVLGVHRSASFEDIQDKRDALLRECEEGDYDDNEKQRKISDIDVAFGKLKEFYAKEIEASKKQQDGDNKAESPELLVVDNEGQGEEVAAGSGGGDAKRKVFGSPGYKSVHANMDRRYEGVRKTSEAEQRVKDQREKVEGIKKDLQEAREELKRMEAEGGGTGPEIVTIQNEGEEDAEAA